MTSLQNAYHIVRRMVFGAPRLRLAGAAGPLVDTYELDCLPPPSAASSSWTIRNNSRRNPPLSKQTSQQPFSPSSIHHFNTTWQDQGDLPSSDRPLANGSARSLHRLSPASATAAGTVQTKMALSEPDFIEETTSYRLDPVVEPTEKTPSLPPVPIWADSVNHRPGI